MTTARLATAAVCAALCTQLSGCFFVFIPSALMQAASDRMTGAEGDHCVATSAQIGDRIRVPEGTGMVVSLSGASSRCADARYPVRAKLAFAS